MSTTWDWVITMQEQRSSEYIIAELVKELDSRRQIENELFASRFFELRKVIGADGEPNGQKVLVKVLERMISNDIDLADCRDGEESEYLYMEDDGSLHPITIGKMTRWAIGEHEMVYGASDMVANGKVVGQVQFTDH